MSKDKIRRVLCFVKKINSFIEAWVIQANIERYVFEIFFEICEFLMKTILSHKAPLRAPEIVPMKPDIEKIKLKETDQIYFKAREASYVSRENIKGIHNF